MSVHEDALRDLAANHGWGFCDAVADEINDLEASYASLFKTHGELQRDLASAQSEITSLTANLSARNAEILEAQEELRAVGGHVGGGAFYRDEHGGRLPMRDQVGQHIAEMNQKLAAAQEELERERMRLVACGVVAMANTPESAADARQIHEDYRSASLSDVERAVNAEMKLRTDLAAAQEALKFVERWANHHGVKPTCTAEAALSIIQHYPPILAITRSYADGKVPETRNPWAELKEAQEARERAEGQVELLLLDSEAAHAAMTALRDDREMWKSSYHDEHELHGLTLKRVDALIERAQRAEALAESLKAEKEAAVAQERERCAKVCDDLHKLWQGGEVAADEYLSPMDCAAAIRRGDD